MQFNAYKMKSYPTWSLILAPKQSGMLTPAQSLFAAGRKPIEELYDLGADPREVSCRGHLPEGNPIEKPNCEGTP